MTDEIVALVERLRCMSRWETMTNEFDASDHIAAQAATTIEKLAGERDAALRECVAASRQAGEWQGKLEASELPGIVDGWKERALAAEAARDAALARVARLEGVLEPFGRVAYDIITNRDDEDVLADTLAADRLTWGHLRAARAALTPAATGDA